MKVIKSFACFAAFWASISLSANPVVINEIMYHPSSANVLEEYLELHNISATHVNLNGWRIRGVNFTFTNDLIMPPGGYVIVAADVATFRAKYPNAPEPVVGGWQGILSNSGERLDLLDASGERVNRVEYADEGDWALRVRGPLDRNYYGWKWHAEHDGLGKSLELIQSRMFNNNGQNWASSTVLQGTPGEPNSVVQTNIAPLISDVSHFPVIPKSPDTVTITARIRDEQMSGVTVTLHYRNASAFSPPGFSTLPMLDDGQNGDGLAGDGVYGARIDPHPSGTVIEFYVEARDAQGNIRTWPAAARQLDGTFAQTANALYQVDDSVYSGIQPIFRVIMTEAERFELQTINRQSNAEMNATLITVDGTSIKRRYNVGVRIRGAGSRTANVPNYRVNIPKDRLWNDVSEINLNAQYGHSQVAGAVLSHQANLAAAQARPIQVRVNGVNLAASGAQNGFATYALLEVVNSEWADNHFPSDRNGNTYAARRPNTDLRYLGTNPDSYISTGYNKTSNQSENDWSDLINLTFGLNNTPDAAYVEEVRRLAHVPNWMTYFALNSLLGNGETTLGTGVGDDYNMYRGVLDPRFLLVPHDWDTILGQGQGPAPVTRDIFFAASLPVVNRFLRHPEFVPLYYAELKRIIETVLSPEQLGPTLDQWLGSYVPVQTLTAMKDYAAARNQFVLSRIPLALTVNSTLPISSGYRRTTSPTVTLSGQANVITTRSIRVNGSPAAWTAWSGNWSISGLAMHPGINRVLVQAFDTGGNEVERNTIDIWYDTGASVSLGGTLSQDTTLSPVAGPYQITSTLSVPLGRTLTIEPGATLYFAQDATLNISGRLVAEGTGTHRIRFTRLPGTVNTWGGINFFNTTESNRLVNVDFEFSSSSAQSINMLNSMLFIDGVSWANTTRRIIEMNQSSLHARNSVFPNVLNTHIVRGNGIPPGGFVIFEGNSFGTTTGENDIIHFTGGRRPGPILQVLNNSFSGGGDDGIDLNGADAHIEGNVFTNFMQDAPRPNTANAIAADQESEITVARNLFYGNDHAVLLRNGSFLTAHNNTMVATGVAAIQFNEPGVVGATAGRGAYLDGNILWENTANFAHLSAGIDLVVNRSIISGPTIFPGTGNLNVNPRFASAGVGSGVWADYELRPGSPAAGTGPNGLDMGALVPGGASIFGEPASPTPFTSVTLAIGGPGITHYRYRVNEAAWSDEFNVSQPVALNGLASGGYTVFVVGKNSAGVWQEESAATMSKTWIVDPGASRVLINEVLARNVRALQVGDEFPDLIELYNHGTAPVDLGGMGITDNPANKFKFTFPSGTIIGPNDYLVLYADDAANAPGIYLGFGLSASGEGVYLYKSDGSLVDSVEFGMQLPDLSIGRLRDGTWALTQPTFGGPNIPQPVGDPRRLKINEWFTYGVSVFPDDFIELYNPDTLPVALGGLYLSDAPIGTPGRHEIFPLSFIAPGGFVAFIADGRPSRGAEHLNFGLVPEQGYIALFDRDLTLIDLITYGAQMADMSEGRRPNGSDTISFFTQPTPGASNPGQSGTTNITAITVNLLPMDGQWRYNQQGIDLGTAWRAPEYNDSSWQSGLALFYVENADLPGPKNTPLSQPPRQLHRTYYFRTTIVVETNLSDFILNLTTILDDGAVIYLNGVDVLRIGMPGTTINFNTLATRTVPDAGLETWSLPTSLLVQGTNYIAAEVHQSAPDSSDIVWGMSVQAVRYVTNVIHHSVVLNEVMANPVSAIFNDADAVDWIEIFNPLDGPMDISDMSLTDRTTNPRRWAFPQGVTIPSRGYLVVRFDSDSPASLVNGPVLNTGFGLKGASGDAVFLYEAPARGGSLADSISFGIQAPDFTVGRLPDSTNWELTLPTPGGPNIAAVLGNPYLLRINEWMANPSSGDDWFEIYNPNAQPVAIGGFHLTDNLNNRTKHRIPPLSFIGTSTNGFLQIFATGSSTTLADHVAFALSNSGEALAISDSTGAFIDSLTFGPQARGVSEGRLPDGAGTIVRFTTTSTPGRSNYLPLHDVLVNEVLTHTDNPLEDAIELHNLTHGAIDIGGWFLSDDQEHLRKFRIPDATVIPAGGFIVFYENQFNPDPGLFPSFALSSSRGDQVHLSQADALGQLTGYRSRVRFGPAENGVSFGRFETSVGADFPAMAARTFGQDNPASLAQFRLGAGRSNAAPKIGPIVINEIMYHPPDGPAGADNVLEEYIELHNLTGASVSLFDPAQPANTWRLRKAVSFNFPQNTTIPAGGYLLVVSFHPGTNATALAAFRAKYGLSAAVPIVGPYSGKLANSSDSIELYKPDPPQPNGLVPYVLVDKVEYSDSAPWPSLADTGTETISLQRRNSSDYGNDPVNWIAGNPTPGAANGPPVLSAPSITTHPSSQTVAPGSTVILAAAATGEAPLLYQWRFNGVDIEGATNASLTLGNVQHPAGGDYTLRVSNPAGAALSQRATLRLLVAPSIVTQPRSLIVEEGATALFSVAAAGTAPLVYEWRHNGAPISGATNYFLRIENVTPAREGNYSVHITNAHGSTSSQQAGLSIQAAPVITSHPVSRTAFTGTQVSFSAGVTGSEPLTYQWLFNGNIIPGAIQPTLVLNNIQPQHSGLYSLRVTNFVGMAFSQPAELTVVVPPVVTVTATIQQASETGPTPGRFRISRTESTASSLTVHFNLTGTALNGTDYLQITSPVVIPAGSEFVDVTVTPIDDTLAEPAETVVLAIAENANYVVGTPASATVVIADNDNQPPVISITGPAPETLYPITPTNVLITVSASDPDGSVFAVGFFNHGTNFLGESRVAPFSFVWTNATPGTNSITAIVVDNLGLMRTSAPVVFRVNIPPTVAITRPQPGSSFAPPATIELGAAAMDADGTVQEVAFYEGTTLIQTVSTPPYTATFVSQEAGTFSFTARARDDLGTVSTSSVVIVSVRVPNREFADMFADRGEITEFTNYVTGSNVNATREEGEPPAYASGQRSVWISWVAPATGTCTMNTFGSNFDTVLAVFTNSPPHIQTVTNLVKVAENDDFDGLQSQVTFNAIAGTVYHVRVEGFGTTTSGNIIFQQNLVSPMPIITSQPQNVAVLQGGNATFNVTATSPTTIFYQWRFNGANIPGATNTSLVISNVQSNSVGFYEVQVWNTFGTNLSQTATLEFGARPTFVIPPQSQIALVGDTITISVVVAGTQPMGFRWRKGASPYIPFELGGPSMTITNVQLSDAADYTVVVTNALTTSVGILSPPGRLTVLVDTDGDRIPDVWEIAHGFNPEDPSDGNVDTDGDGFTNLQEWLAGTDPRDLQSFLKIDQISSGLAETVMRFTAVSNRAYTVQYSGVLPPNWVTLTNVLTRATNRVESVIDRNPAGDARFYRILTPALPFP
jgi:hypothetical protein